MIRNLPVQPRRVAEYGHDVERTLVAMGTTVRIVWVSAFHSQMQEEFPMLKFILKAVWWRGKKKGFAIEWLWILSSGYLLPSFPPFSWMIQKINPLESQFLRQ